MRLAVFDFDGTCINGQSGALFSRYLQKRGLISFPRALRLGWWGARYVLHLPHRQDEPREVIFDTLGAMDPARVRSIMRDFHDEVLLGRYRSDAVREIGRRRDEGCLTLLVSATFQGIAEVAADHLGVDGFVATLMRRDASGRYTGDVDGDVIQGAAKPRAVRDWADEHIGHGRWTLAYAYGDHHSDEELLASAEHPYAVCPGKTLLSIAKKNDWPVLEWN